MLFDRLRVLALTSLLCSLPSCGGDDNHGGPSDPFACTEACGEDEVCVLGECQVDTGQTLEPPEEPKCYTPCRGGSDCDRDRLVEGCIAGLECVDGTCVAPTDKQEEVEATPGDCARDSECPDFQSCIRGRCYSDCAEDSDCRGERMCVRRRCSLPCTAEGEECGDGETCRLRDGLTGFCAPSAKAGGSIDSPDGTFTIDTQNIVFTNTKTSASFTISNDSDDSKTFSIRKTEHRAFSSTGSETETEDALSWLKIASDGVAATTDNEVLVTIDGGEEAAITLSDAAGDWESWNGHLLVSNAVLGEADVSLSFKAGKEGRWAGTMYFLAANFGENGLDTWLENKHSAAATSTLGNAFIQRWTAFRDNELSEIEFRAMLTATEEGSWQWRSVQDKCPRPGAPNPNVGCYLSLAPDGVSVYSDSLEDFPIPSGVSKLPIQMNLHADADDGPSTWTGKIVSRETMHYPGDPAIRIDFDEDPTLCDGEGSSCKTLITDFNSTITVGGRYGTSAAGSCATGFDKLEIPWLVDGFEFDTSRSGSRRVSYDCRQTAFPFGDDPDFAELNANAAGSNPIGDGAARTRNIELIDGAMIGGDTLFVIFKESMPSFVDPTSDESQTGYGYMVLKPASADLEDDAYDGSNQTIDGEVTAPGLSQNGCSSDVLQAIADSQGSSSLALDSDSAAEIGLAVVSGVAADLGSPISSGEVHFFCEDDGLFDSSGCGASARTYFVSTGTPLSSSDIEALACMNSPTGGMDGGVSGQVGCLTQFNDWLDDGDIEEPIFSCPETTPNCIPTTFYRPGGGTPAFPDIRSAIEDAFAYKTQFAALRGDNTVGFAPVPCDGSTPYCYDAAAIEQIMERVDCAAHIYTNYYSDIADTPAKTEIKSYLHENFGWQADGSSAGFERLLAQLLIMLGDDAYARTFTTRFDLSGELTNASFEGSLFEPGGSDFTGPAGFEMNSLYKSGQYYQLVLDRFFSHALTFQASLKAGSGGAVLPEGEGFIDQGTASAYVERLLLASSQKSRAWTEVAKRYQSFNESELAALILGRAYAGSYLESVVLSDLMDDLSKGAPDTQKAQLYRQLEQAQRTYSVALLDMNTANRQITDEVTVFGFPPEYIPFPTTDEASTALGQANAFDKAFARAKDFAETAQEKEDRAIQDATKFAGSEAEFFQELSTINLNFEGQLQEICGTFEGDDGVVYAAIPQYADKSARTRALGDPCGFVGNGAIHDALLELDQSRLDVLAIEQQRTNLLAEIQDTDDRTQEQCDSITDLRDLKIGLETTKSTLKATVQGMQFAIDAANSTLEATRTLAQLSACEPPGATSAGNCANAAVSISGALGAATTHGAVTTPLELAIKVAETAIDTIDIGSASAEFDQQCDALEIDAAYALKDLYRRSLEIEIEAHKAQLAIQQTMSKVLKYRNDASSVNATWEQTKAHAIDVAAAWNDPNVRIYKNDAIINAERTFDAAITEAYKATKVFEYFSGQSYAGLEKLYLVRMVQFGNPSLESYLTELDNAYQEFQQTYGNPEDRVLVVSLLDDILAIPELGPNNSALTRDERRELLHDALAGSDYRDGNGRFVFPFATVLERVSPQTFNHKVRKIEVEITPQIGDRQARLYLIQRGTGAVKTPDDDISFVSLPQRQAVLESFFAGEKPLSAEVYENETMRDRPLINTGWELVFDPQAESVNRDVDVGRLDDIRLYLYYWDFTEQ